MYISPTRLVSAVLLLLMGNGLWSQSASTNQPKTVTETLDESIFGAERAVLGLGHLMPADRYSFTPTNGEFTGVRNFAQMLKHVAVDNYVNGAALLGETPPNGGSSSRERPRLTDGQRCHSEIRP